MVAFKQKSWKKLEKKDTPFSMVFYVNISKLNFYVKTTKIMSYKVKWVDIFGTGS